MTYDFVISKDHVEYSAPVLTKQFRHATTCSLSELRLPQVFSAVHEAVPRPSIDLPSDAPPGNFARCIENQLAFLRNAARRWHRDKAGADDLVQDTVVQALANAHLWREGQPESNLRGWLFTIMRNRFLAGRVRSKRSDAALDAIAAADECVPAAASRPEARLMMRDLERGLSLLSAPQRTAICLVGVEGRSYDEAARLMGLSVPAVRCHLARGRERLRKMVEGRTASPAHARSLPLSRRVPSHLEPSPSLLKQPEYA
jgi:RNA polymerase sigma factor (sigma-70 family)